MHISSYPSIYAIGHKAIEGLFDMPVLIEEKIDGSQFSFGLIDGELICRSKGKDMLVDAPEKMFARAVGTIKALDLHKGWIYRAEYLEKPKHNTLAYARTPERYIILFDVSTGIEEYLGYEAKATEAARLGLEVVPMLFEGKVDSLAMFNTFLERESVLGGAKVEGVVVKNYALFTLEKKFAIGKYVSESFKEKHATDWKERNPTQTDVVQRLIETYRTDARWQKAVQHLRDDGKLEGSPRDIGVLIREIPADVLKEETDVIKEVLFAHFWKDISRGITTGFPEWYKQQLAATAFPPERELETV